MRRLTIVIHDEVTLVQLTRAGEALLVALVATART